MNKKGTTKMFREFGVAPAPPMKSAVHRGITEINLTPEIMQRSRSVKAVRYDELIEALQTAQQHGRGVAVDARLYWDGWKDRSIYMALFRLSKHHNVNIRSDRSHRESDGVVYLWLDGVPGDSNLPTRRGPGRPRKLEAGA